jgi:FkbM family methyltransferase
VNILKQIFKKGLNALGYKIISNQNDFNKELSMEAALRRCAQRGLNVNTVIDVGASNGMWSRMCIKYLSESGYLLIEAQQPHEPALKEFVSEFPQAQFVLAAAGRTKGIIYFNNSDLFGGVASEVPLEGTSMSVPAVTIDEEVKTRKLKPPYLIKLDTHGFEVPILEGARETLNHSSLVIIETYNYKLSLESLRYYEMASYMEKRGFSSIEMVDFMLRRKDKSFWQMDTFYIPSNSKEFQFTSFH